MASSDKTKQGLNLWSAEDRPKREDFNADNKRIDAVVDAITQSLDETGEQLAAARRHSEDASVHVSAAEKEQMLGGGMVMGSYEGTGASSRLLELGFQPRAGIVFPSGAAPIQLTDGYTMTYMDFFSDAMGVGTLPQANGLYVSNQTGVVNNNRTCLNEAGRKYVYIVWR